MVLVGRCYLQESVPYKALDSLIDALSRYLTSLPRHEVEALVPAEIGSSFTVVSGLAAGRADELG